MNIKLNFFGLWLVLLLVSLSCHGQPPAPSAATLSVPGLKEKVTVRRDGRGIPYIEAASDADLYFAQGFVTASDRLWQMDLLRRVARGESAEIFGKVTLDEDKRWRKFGFSQIAEESLPQLAPDLRNALENYARGVNAYIATLDAQSLPTEFKILSYQPRPWKATDTLCIGKILADGLSTTWQYDLLRAGLTNVPQDRLDALLNSDSPYDVILFAKDREAAKKSRAPLEQSGNLVKFDAALAELVKRQDEIRKTSLARVGIYSEDLAASNNWVISGKRTTDGKPILANDPHLAPTAPGIWYLANLASPEQRVAGVTLPGVPGIVLGHNENIAWGATNVGPDVQDLYVEEFNDQNQYRTPGGWANPVIRREEIKVRVNALAPETTTEVLEVTETRHGVIFVENAGQKMALRWTARDPQNQEFGAFIRLDKAQTWADFQSALKTYGGATQNFVYADRQGNIGWYAAGRIPLRRTGDGALPYNGATDEGDWTGVIPFEELPHLYNPPEGFIVTANQRTVGRNYKYPQYARDVAQPYRARRIYDSIAANNKITMDAVGQIQFDVLSLPLSNLTREILKTGAASVETLASLKNWDYRMTADSKAALLANEIYNVLAGKIREANFPGRDDGKPSPVSNALVRERLLDRLVREQPLQWLPKEFSTYAGLFKACDAEARANLVKRLGTDETKYVWGAVFQSRLPHPLAGALFIGAQFATPVVPLNGSGSTPNVGSNVSMRFIASPGNWDATRHVIPLGESGDPKAKHFKDQFEFWRSGVTPIFPFSRQAVETAARETVVLQPK